MGANLRASGSSLARATREARYVLDLIRAGRDVDVVKVVRPAGAPESGYIPALRSMLDALGLQDVRIDRYTLPPGMKGLEADVVIMDEVSDGGS